MRTTFANIKKRAKDVVELTIHPSGNYDHEFKLKNGLHLEVNYDDDDSTGYQDLLNGIHIFPNLEKLIDPSGEGTSIDLSKSNKKLNSVYITYKSVKKYAKHLQKVNIKISYSDASDVPEFKRLFPNSIVKWDDPLIIVKPRIVKERGQRQTVCEEGYKKSKTTGKCRKIVLPKTGTVCREGYKMTKNGRCIVDKSYGIPEKGQRQTVCYEGYKMTKDGRCIKDKNYKTIVVPIDQNLPQIIESVKSAVKQPSVKQPSVKRESTVRSPSFRDYMVDRVDEF